MLFIIAATLMASPTFADQPEGAYRMMVVSNKALGQVLLDGDYREALDKLAVLKDRPYGFALSNNLCVAYVNIGKADRARAACERAVRRSRSMPRRDQAIALSNRGVVRALNGDIDGAMLDFRSAIRLRRDLDEPRENLSRLVSASEADFSLR